MSINKTKFGYLSYGDMLQKITDGVLDQNDIIFTKDTKEVYIISSDLEPIALKSKVYVYNSVEEAISSINKNKDTYIGQIVSILEGDTYRGYIVNKNIKQRNVAYTVSPLTDTSSIDYNTLGNRPITNMVGTLDSPIIINTLSSGIYKIKGQYKISETEETVYLSVDGDLFLIETSDTKMFAKRFTKDTIYDFVITTNSVSKTVYITDEYLKNQGYATTDYIDTKVIALEDSIKKDIEAYIGSIIADKVDNMLDEKLTKKLDEMIQEAPNEEVENLFQ